MKLTIKQSYIAMFLFLDECYAISQDDALGGLLGSMVPYLTHDPMPMDSAKWADWIECVEKTATHDRNELDEQEAFQAMKEFLELYKTEFGFDLTWIIAEVNKAESKEKWKKYVHEAMTYEV